MAILDRLCRPALAAALAVLAPGAARADWQYTAWGMSPGAVAAASKGAAVPNDDRKLDAGGLTASLTAPYVGASLPFTAVFLFDGSDKLQTVSLTPVGRLSCPVIREALQANHGEPAREIRIEKTVTVRWNDADNDNLVVFLDLGTGDCSIQYSKLPPTRPDQKSL